MAMAIGMVSKYGEFFIIVVLPATLAAARGWGQCNMDMEQEVAQEWLSCPEAEVSGVALDMDTLHLAIMPCTLLQCIRMSISHQNGP